MEDYGLEIKKLYGRLKADQGNWLSVWQDIADYMVPWRANIVTRSTPGRRTVDRIFDSTAPQALTTAASAVHSSVTPSTLRWFSLTTSDPDLLNEDGVVQWLDDLSNRAFSFISNSNFDSEAQEVYSDLFAFGTALMVVEDDNDDMGTAGLGGIRFHAQQPGTFVIKEGANGRVDTIIREVPMNVGSVVARWGLENVSDRTKDLFEAHKVDESVEVLHYIGPRKDGIAGDLAPKRKKIASVWLEMAGTMSMAPIGAGYLTLLSESGFDEMPVMAPRWRKMSGEVYGRSPGMVVLPDVRTINKAVELRLKAWTLAIAPPIVTQDRGVIGNIRLEPFGRNYVRPGATIDTLDIPSRFDVANFQEEQLRASIQQGFFVDLLQFQSKSGNPISATEASIRFQTMQKILGPVVSRLQSEFLAPLIARVLQIMRRNNMIPPPPPALGDGGLELVFEGPLARVQRSTNVEAINQFFSLIFPVAEIDRNVLTRIDFNEVVETLAEATSLPARLLRSRTEADKIVQAREQAEQQQAMMANVLEAGKVLQGGAGASPA